MAFNSKEVESKMTEIENKISFHTSKINELRDILVKLNSIIDINDFERNDDGSIKYDTTGQRVEKTITPVDQFTGETLSDERRNQIKNALFAKFDEQSS